MFGSTRLRSFKIEMLVRAPNAELEREIAYGVDVGGKGIQVDQGVYSDICESRHAAGMVCIWVNVVDANCVCT